MKKQVEIRRLGLYLNRLRATSYYPDSGSDVLTRVPSGMEGRERFAGETTNQILVGNNRSTNNEHHKHNREADKLRAYMKNLSAQMEPYGDIVVMGPRILLHQLENFLKENGKNGSAKRVVFLERDKMTDNEFRAAVRRHFAGEQQAD